MKYTIYRNKYNNELVEAYQLDMSSIFTEYNRFVQKYNDADSLFPDFLVVYGKYGKFGNIKFIQGDNISSFTVQIRSRVGEELWIPISSDDAWITFDEGRMDMFTDDKFKSMFEPTSFLPCPFCNSSDIRLKHMSGGHGEPSTHYIRCNKCGASIWFLPEESYGPTMSENRWNNRQK